MHRLKELKIWNKAIELASEVYAVTANFPKEEKYGLVSQIRRATVSISSNIAEGVGRTSQNEFLHFLSISNGSSYELQTQLIISEQLELVNEDELNILLTLLEEIQKMNFKLQQSIRINKNIEQPVLIQNT